jgi:hypothetical protein
VNVSDPAKGFRMHGDTPLLGERPPEKGPPLRVRLDLEFLPSDVPGDRRLAQALKLLWRRFKARNRGCVEVPE